jgi:hypothetical protein
MEGSVVAHAYAGDVTGARLTSASCKLWAGWSSMTCAADLLLYRVEVSWGLAVPQVLMAWSRCRTADL